jgi:hypothetical protein
MTWKICANSKECMRLSSATMRPFSSSVLPTFLADLVHPSQDILGEMENIGRQTAKLYLWVYSQLRKVTINPTSALSSFCLK